MEAIGEISKRIVARARHQREALARSERTSNLPAMQPHPKEQKRPVPERDRNPGRNSLEVLALRLDRGGVVR